ncbi:acyl-CoA N-acyltransferase [Thamnocephalis sphaerospora]|uniref:Acyl-CoA N-acyltransferase n=1 Tax=Thamnocephalis sphaerospora TaxID=78915 RepID=A0A4P9XSW8_9FUNG|nr:acyl-CoA N-acyltransferase [Thamnocephalis sphaerospora]|eukprot:RKP09255.1 acyl-CoA N-acyltransferase [Thamnocephalis sphaerospora]
MAQPRGQPDRSIVYTVYRDERQLADIITLLEADLSEPYSIYTYRYFIHGWPSLCFLAWNADEAPSGEQDRGRPVGVIVCKLDEHRGARRGYIGMLAVAPQCRKRGIGSQLVCRAIDAMIAQQADEVVLETECHNQGALNLYEQLGFVRDKRLHRYYLNGVDAFRLKLWTGLRLGLLEAADDVEAADDPTSALSTSDVLRVV